MTRTGSSLLSIAITVAVPLCTVLAVGCSKTEEPGITEGTAVSPSRPGAPGRERMGDPGSSGPGGGRMGGPGGRMGGPGGRQDQPVAVNATAIQIYQQKCQFCHGDKGQGVKGPALTKAANRPSAELRKIIHDGHEKMPAFGKQMTAAQLDAVVSYVKQFGSKQKTAKSAHKLGSTNRHES